MNIIDLQNLIVSSKQKILTLNQGKRFILTGAGIITITLAIIGLLLFKYWGILNNLILTLINDNLSLFAPLICFILMYSPFISLYLIGRYAKYICNIYVRIFDFLYELNCRLLDKVTSINTINEILGLTENIHDITKKLEKISPIIYILYGIKVVKELNSLLIIELKWLNLVLTELRSDLQLRLEEQQKTLEQAKSEVKENIQGTIELEQVSELQRARLDKQIEQFEELQRVLN